MFQLTDIVLISLYIGLIIFIGYRQSRKQSHEGYLIADRNMGIMESIATMNATKTGAVLLSYTALLYLYGPSAFWAFIGTAVGFISFLPFARQLRNHSQQNFYTLSDYFRKKFGELSAKLVTLLNVILMLGFFVVNLIAAAKVLSLMTGLEIVSSGIVVSTLVVIYLLLSGFQAVVRTDLLQYIMIVMILLFFTVILNGSVNELQPHTATNVGAASIIGFFLIGFILPFASPDVWQRVYAMKNTAVVRKSIIWSVVIYVSVGVVMTHLGMLIYQALPSADPDIAIVEGFIHLLPNGLLGLAIIVFFGAFMSSMDTYAFTAASSIVQDFFQKTNPKEKVQLIRYGIFTFVLLATIVALFLQSVVIGSLLFIAYAAIVCVAVLASWWRKHISAITINSSLIIGTILLTLSAIKDYADGTVEPTLVIIGLFSALIGIGIGIGIGSIISRIKQKHT